MDKHRSFRPSDFSLRDFSLRNTGRFLTIYLVISAVMICIGLFLEALPEFWKGALLGGGWAWMAAVLLFRPKAEEIDVAALPQPSAAVRAKCDDPNCTFVEAVKAYRYQTGLGLSKAMAVIESYTASKRLLEQDDPAVE